MVILKCDGQAASSILKKRFPSRSLTVEDGLLNNQTNSIFTDKLGFTWVSTLSGLQRFDGYKLITIEPVAGRDTFKINYPVYLFGLQDGKIWISIREGILQFNSDSGIFRLIIHSADNPFAILPLKETPEGIWCLQQNGGVVIYNKDGKLLSTYSFFDQNIIKDIFQSGRFLGGDIVTTDSSSIYINNSDSSLLLINTIKKTGAILNPHVRPIQAVVSSHHRLYLMTSNKLFFTSRNDSEKFTAVDLSAIPDQNIIRGCLLKINSNNFLLSKNRHLYTIDSNGVKRFELADIDGNPFVINGFIRHIYVDRFNRIWLLSNNNITRVQNLQLPFDNLFYPGDQNNFIRSLAYDEKKHILIAGCFNGEIQLYDSLANPILSKPLSTVEGGYILSIEPLDSEHYLLINSFKGWFILNLNTKEITPSVIPTYIANDYNPAEDNFANNTQRINDSIILIANANNIFKCVFRKNKLVSAKKILPLDFSKQLGCFVCTGAGHFWAGTTNGILYSVAYGKIRSDTIPGNYAIRCISAGDSSRVWVGTEKGLYLFDSTAKIIRRFYTESGLRNDFIYSLIPVDGGVFVATNLGLSRISGSGSITNFTKEMGLQGNEFNTDAALKTGSGKLFFGGTEGITAFYPSALSVVNDSPKLYLTHFEINDSSMNSSAGLWHGDTINLNYRQNHLKFDVAAMGMFDASEYVYQFRMVGAGTNWQTVNQISGINYTLPPGNYTLELKCYPALDPALISYRNYRITIFPPWWKTGWFYLLLAITFCVIAYLIFQIRLRRLARMHKIRQQIASDLHDDIGSALSSISISAELVKKVSSDEFKMNRLLNRINATSRETLDSMSDIVWAINPQNDSAATLLLKMQRIATDLLESKGITVHFECDKNFERLKLGMKARKNILLIYKEVVHNISKHSGCTDARIFLGVDNKNTLKIEINDNGKGFDQSIDSSGNGLYNLRRRSSELDAHLDIQTQRGCGTQIKLLIDLTKIRD